MLRQKLTGATLARGAAAIAAFGLATIVAESEALAHHELSIDIAPAHGVEGEPLPIGVTVKSTCGMNINRRGCEPIVTTLYYDCEYVWDNAAQDHVLVCDESLSQIHQGISHASVQEFLFVVPGSDVESPSFEFYVRAFQVEISCPIFGPCSWSDDAHARAPASGLESVDVTGWGDAQQPSQSNPQMGTFQPRPTCSYGEERAEARIPRGSAG